MQFHEANSIFVCIHQDKIETVDDQRSSHKHMLRSITLWGLTGKYCLSRKFQLALLEELACLKTYSKFEHPETHYPPEYAPEFLLATSNTEIVSSQRW